VHQKPVDVQRLVARRVGRLEYDRAALLGVGNPGGQSGLEQLAFMLEFLHEIILAMSRAFVKESDQDSEVLPERAISPHPNLVTRRGLALLEARVRAL
jgi:hypothetical protein